MSLRSVSAVSANLRPSTLDLQADLLSLFFQQIKVAANNRVLSGLLSAAPTTPSAQITGGGNTTWNINVAAGIAAAGGVLKEFAAQADLAIHSGSKLLDNGQSVIAALVVKNVTGTVTMVAVKGTVATTGSQVTPSASVIQAAVGAGNDWIRIADLTLNRTADTTVTQSQDNTRQPIMGVNIDTTFGTLVG